MSVPVPQARAGAMMRLPAAAPHGVRPGDVGQTVGVAKVKYGPMLYGRVRSSATV